MKRRWQILKRRSLWQGAIAFLMTLGLAFFLTVSRTGVTAAPSPSAKAVQQNSLQQLMSGLPEARPHTMPPSLAHWQASKDTSDYFDQIRFTPVGALVWSHFPVAVYVQPPERDGSPFVVQRAQTWVTAVEQAIQEWNAYLPLLQVEQAKNADITVWRTSPPLRFETNKDIQTRDRPSLLISRARSAETVFELYAKPTSAPNTSPLLAHRIKIYIRPDQADIYLKAAARHELGHALGIWGHSLQETDALYFSQVRNPASVSQRDVNTLKRVYEQPTRLGWLLKETQRESVGEPPKL